MKRKNERKTGGLEGKRKYGYQARKNIAEKNWRIRKKKK